MPTRPIRGEPNRLSRRGALALGVAACGLTLRAAADEGAADLGIGHDAETIHQEPTFDAARSRVYRALTDAAQFEALTQLSDAAKRIPARHPPTTINAVAGGGFTLFGGFIGGRHVELVPDALVVQAWRSSSWARGLYSIARFQFLDAGTGTRLLFDHTGFPVGEAGSLAKGWHLNYWEPLRRFLAGA